VVAPQAVTSRVFTMVEKLNPKSMPLMVTPPPEGDDCVKDCGTLPPAVSDAKVAEVVLLIASLEPGTSPPTRSMTSTAAPEVAIVRNVCTGTQAAHAAPPVREDRTVPFTTRTYICAPALPPLEVSE
jgi:hypothetical protein